MKTKLPNPLTRALREFFSDHLPRIRGMSPHTVHSYRDTFVLLLRFVASRKKRAVVDLNLEDIGHEEVVAFLGYLEEVRKNIADTRNVRLAAIHSFFRFVATLHPDRLEQCQRILGIPFKRGKSRPVEYLEYDEIAAVLSSVDRSSRHGRRDYVLLATMFNTGARVQEIIDLRACDLQLVRPFQTRIFGKGRKERICPLWPQTAQLLKEFCAEQKVEQHSSAPIFLNARGQPLTRFGVRYILAKYLRLAQVTTPTLARKKLYPHSMRHSNAVHLLKAGVDLSTISQWLGHETINTTNRYATVDLDMKREAIERAKPTDCPQSASPSWRNDASVLEWLEGL